MLHVASATVVPKVRTLCQPWSIPDLNGIFKGFPWEKNLKFHFKGCDLRSFSFDTPNDLIKGSLDEKLPSYEVLKMLRE